MVNYRQIARAAKEVRSNGKEINWFPGHMYAGMKKMIGKLNTVDCVIEVHDARIPFTGRNSQLKVQLGTIKPHLLVLNKSDLADLSRWSSIERRLHEQNDQNILLTDLTGSDFSFSQRGYPKLMNKVVELINKSNRFNRQEFDSFKVMIVGIPNVGKSTLINRLRQHHLGSKGEPAKTAGYAGVTRQVETMIKICARPLVYSIDTPGVLEPGSTRNEGDAMRLALCSSINDDVLNIEKVAKYLFNYLNERENYMYMSYFGIDRLPIDFEEMISDLAAHMKSDQTDPSSVRANPQQRQISVQRVCWDFVKGFRKGCYGKMMLD